MAKRGPKKNVDLKLVKGTYHSTRDSAENQNTKDTTAVSSKLRQVRKLPAKVRKVWEQYAPLLWWNTEAESDLFDTWCELTVDLTNFKTGKDTRYHWTTAMMTQYRLLGADLGIGVSNKKYGIAAPVNPGEVSEHFDD